MSMSDDLTRILGNANEEPNKPASKSQVRWMTNPMSGIHREHDLCKAMGCVPVEVPDPKDDEPMNKLNKDT